MQDRYVGDAGDFGKYGLLRCLAGYPCAAGGPKLRLGIVWYLTPDESGNADGKHIRYLNPTAANISKFRKCDSGLWDALGDMVREGPRAVAEVANRGILPPETVFCSDAVFTRDVRPSEREKLRWAWSQSTAD